MGMGDFPAGSGPAGADPVYKPATALPVVGPRAVFYDPSIRQYVLTDASGRPLDVHPIDQIVASRTTSQKNQSTSSPDLGTRILARFKLAPPSRHPQIAYQEMASVLADLITAGDIQLLGVTLTVQPSNGAQIVIPNYINLRNPASSTLYPANSP